MDSCQFCKKFCGNKWCYIYREKVGIDKTDKDVVESIENVGVEEVDAEEADRR